MAGGTSRGKSRRKVSTPARAKRPVLGNDPFERGAATREPVEKSQAPGPLPPGPGAAARAAEPDASAATPPVRPERSAASSSPNGGAGSKDAAPRPTEARAADHVEDHVDEKPVEDRPRSPFDRLRANGGGATLAALEEEAREVVARLLPALRARLGSLADLVRLFEPAERLDRHGMDPRFAERLAPLVEFFYSSWWRVQVRNASAVPAAGPAVVVANHAGLVPWDAFVLRHALFRDHPARRDLRPLLDDREVELPVIGPAAIRAGAVRASPEAAARILSAGEVLGVFPEGNAAARKPWRDRYTLVHFGRGGFVKVALRAGAPIVPCAVVGSEEASAAISRTGWIAERIGVPLLAANPALRVAAAAMLPLPSRWTLRFGDPIETAALGAGAAGDPATVNQLAERVRSAIQAMLDEDVAARTSVFL